MESEQTGLAFSLPPSPDRACANSPVEFLPDFQFPSPKARDFVSFGLDDILHTAASDSEDFGPALADALPPNSQEARPSAATRHPISGMSSLARHYDSSVTLPSRMGAFTRGIAVGSPHISNRLHSSVWEKSPPFRRGSPDSSKQRRQGFCSTTGTFLPPAERSNRGSTAVGSQTRFLQPLLPRSKEGRRLEAYPGSTAFESFPLQREVQNADDENHHVSGPGGRLVCHHRPEGCVFSHPGRSQTQEIPSVRLWREGLPIQGSALRPGFGPEDIYQMHGCCTGPFEAPGHPFRCRPVWLLPGYQFLQHVWPASS